MEDADSVLVAGRQHGAGNCVTLLIIKASFGPLSGFLYESLTKESAIQL